MSLLAQLREAAQPKARWQYNQKPTRFQIRSPGKNPMQSTLTTEKTWFLIPNEREPGMPPRIKITPPFRIGRREGFDLCLDCRNVSGLHAELVHEYGQLWLEDLNSTNGTFVNGARVRTRMALKDGDSVQIGLQFFAIACHGDENDGEENSSPRRVCQTIDGTPETPEAETTEQRFERLLEGGVIPFFQPIYNISGDSKQRIGYEVLGRSRLFGLKTPDQMFAIATDLEKESELSRTLRMRGLEAAKSNLPANMMLFVNTHPAEMDCKQIQESLKEIRLEFPSRPIMLELPERVLYSPDDYSNLIVTTKELGVQLVIHDFGAGQIRLAELAELAPDVVKFDGALLQGIDTADEKRIRLVTAMVKMVTELGITPMAEYVETQAEHETLKELGFELVQGYYYGHPEDIESFADESASPAPDAPDIEEPETTTVERSLAPAQADTADYNDAQWLMKKDDDRFTLQLMFSATEKGATQFIAQCDEPGDYALYRKWSSDREWFVVVYGIFNSRNEAQSVIEQFADTGHSSWVRKMTAVKEEIQSVEGSANADQ